MNLIKKERFKNVQNAAHRQRRALRAAPGVHHSVRRLVQAGVCDHRSRARPAVLRADDAVQEFAGNARTQAAAARGSRLPRAARGGKKGLIRPFLFTRTRATYIIYK